MDIYKLKFTRLQTEILRFLFIHTGIKFNQRNLANKLGVSPTAVAKSLKLLEKENLIKAFKDENSQTFQIGLNLENPHIFQIKRAENIKMLYGSGLVDFLSETFSGATIALFGSFSFGEDNNHSDIDIAIIGIKEKNLNLEKYEKLFSKKIILQFYNDFASIHKNLRESILNGIILKGSVRL